MAYTKLPNSENGNLSESEVRMMKKSTRWVVFLAFFQLMMAIFSANLLHWIMAAIFVPLGIVGAIRQRPKMLVAHFVYSVFQYIFSLIGIVYLILYCDECSWPIYLIAFLIILVQDVGMRHSRILIALVKFQQTATLPMVVPQQQELQSQQIDMQQPSATPQFPIQEQSMEQQQQQPFHQPMFYAIPMPYGQQQQGQPGMVPQFYPVPMGYPLLHPQQQQQHAVVMPEAPVYPTVYKQ